MEYITMNNGGKCPAVGLGTFMIAPSDAENSVREALKMGYECIDTANAYVNERAVGRGIKSSGVPREKIFLSTKLWASEYENENAVEATLERLGVDYVDLLYIHQPAGNWLAGYRQLEKAFREGKARAIGVSNFEGKYLDELAAQWEVVPQFMQAEAHPYYTQEELRRTLDKYGIKLMSWYPLGNGDKALLAEPLFAELGEKVRQDTRADNSSLAHANGLHGHSGQQKRGAYPRQFRHFELQALGRRYGGDCQAEQGRPLLLPHRRGSCGLRRVAAGVREKLRL